MVVFLNNQLPACTDTDPDCDDTEHHDSDDTSQPSTSNTRPTSGNVDALRETEPNKQSRLSRTEIDTLIREGGFVNGYHVFTATSVQQCVVEKEHESERD